MNDLHSGFLSLRSAVMSDYEPIISGDAVLVRTPESAPAEHVAAAAKLSEGEYEVHNIGINWPHHVFVNQDFKMVGAN
jgi:hypothetical protein